MLGPGAQPCEPRMKSNGSQRGKASHTHERKGPSSAAFAPFCDGDGALFPVRRVCNSGQNCSFLAAYYRAMKRQ